MEGQGSSDTEYTVIVSTADSLDSSVIFHVINDVVGFVLYMHQQIPSTLQDISLEFDTLHSEYTELEMDLSAQTDAKAVPSLRRKHIGRMREVKRGIRRLDKLMSTVSNLKTALKLMMSSEIAYIREVVLVLGASPIRPLHVYQLCLSHGKVVVRGEVDFAKSRAADGLSRKVIRTLISKDAGSGSYPGPSKLFLLVKAPSSFNLPLHFLPKREFRYSKKDLLFIQMIVPFRLRLKCKTQYQEMGAPDHASQTGSSIGLTDSASDDLIWFQCRHVIKGLASSTPTEE